MAKQIIESLITVLGFEFDDKDVSKYEEALSSVIKTTAAVVGAATAAAAGIYAFTQKIAESSDKIGKFARQTGINVETLQELGYVAQLNGGSVDSMNSALASLTKTASEASRGVGGNVETFGMLGIAVTDASGKLKSTEQLVGEVADSISRLSTQAERLEFSQRLGFGQDLLLSLEQGSKKLAEQREEARVLGFVIDQEAALAAEKFNDAMLRQKSIMKGVANEIGTRLMKQLVPFIEESTKWFSINKKIIGLKLTAFLDKVQAGLKIVFTTVRRGNSLLQFFIERLGGVEKAAMIAGTALIALNARALLLPTLVIAGATAIFLLLEDIQKYAEDGDSVIGDLADRFPTFDAILKTTIDLLKQVEHGWNLIFTEGDAALEGLMLMIKDIGDFIDKYIIQPVDNAIKKFDELTNASKIAPAIFKQTFIGKVFGKVSDTVEEVAESDTMSNFFRDLGKFTINPGSTTPTPATVTNSYTKPVVNNITNNATINVENGTVQNVKQAVKEVISEEYRGAGKNLQTNVEF